MTRRTAIGACLAAAGRVASAQNSGTERAKKVIDDAIAALGGEKFVTMRDRVEGGRAYSFYRQELSGRSIAKIYTRYLVRPEPPVAGFFGQRERQNFGKNEEYGVLLTETEGYDVSFHGARPLAADVLERYRETTLRNIFYILRQRLGEPGLVMESRGADVIENQPVELLEITDNDNRVVNVAFHTSTKLPVRQQTDRRDPITHVKIEEVTLYSKYRNLGGFQWPYQIQRHRDGEKIFEIFSDTVQMNVGLTDNIFTLPSNVKILKKK